MSKKLVANGPHRHHPHAYPGDSHHDAHIGGTSSHHLSQAVEELHRQHPPAMNAEQRGKPTGELQHMGTERGGSLRTTKVDKKRAIRQHPTGGVGKRHDPEG